MDDGATAAALHSAKHLLAKDLQLGEIVWVEMPCDHHVGSELYSDSPRPYLVVSSNARIQGGGLGVVLAVPLTTGGERHRFSRFRAEIEPDEITRTDDRLREIIQLAVVDQLRAISEERIVGRAGKISQYAMNQVKASLMYALSLDVFEDSKPKKRPA